MAVDNQLNPVLGIDLGTTFSAIAYWDGRGPRHFQTKTGENTLQSVVYYNPENDEFLVGKLAYMKGLLFPDRMALGVKRLMDDASKRVTIGGRDFSPVELSARILGHLYSDVKEKFPTGRFQSRGTVVTVPYYFKAHQCENTRAASEQADIECMGILQEPIAASLAYAWQMVQEQPEREAAENILVFDLGGGTFDLTLFRLEQSKDKLLFEVLATGGDDRLGGMDFDECLVKLILEKSGISLAGLAPKEERAARQKVMTQALDAKITLSSTDQTYVAVAEVIPGKNIDTEITRDEFENCIESYVNKIASIIDSLWVTANIKPAQVDRVIRVGGSSLIPCMKALLDDLVGEAKVWSNVQPSLCVAEGAAMYAAYLDDNAIFGREIEIRTRTCHALGVETSGGGFYPIIPANRMTPCGHSQIFTTDADNMTSLDINVYQGSAPRVSGNSLIGTVSITGLPARPAGDLDVTVTFNVSEEQAVSVTVEAEGMRKQAILKFA